MEAESRIARKKMRCKRTRSFILSLTGIMLQFTHKGGMLKLWAIAI